MRALMIGGDFVASGTAIWASAALDTGTFNCWSALHRFEGPVHALAKASDLARDAIGAA